jgi:N-acyl-D-aspartate/D-glutamate deacylase
MPTDAQHAELRRLFEEALDAGGCGWSAQRQPPSGPLAVQPDYDGTPMVTDVMHDETCEVFADVLAKRNAGFTQLAISTGDIERDRAHAERLATISGRPLLWNVIQAFDQKPEMHRGGLAWLASCRERGIRVYGQGLTTDGGFVFTFEDWNLWDDMPAWKEATLGTVSERLAKLADPARRPDLRAQVPFAVTGPIADIVVTGPRSQETGRWLDHTIGQVAEALGKHPVDALLDIAVADELTTEFFAAPPNVSLENLKEIIDDPYVLLGVSDGGAHTKFLTAGRYPTETICKVVREHKMISLEEAHWRLSALPAEVAGFRDRGQLKADAPADIIIYDFDGLRVLPDEIAHDLPGGEWRRIQRSEGYRYILVNGEVTMRNGQPTNNHSGRLLRHGA